jgi:hypothetical protein
MSFSSEWDECYKASTHMSIWPWSDIVSYVLRYACPVDPSVCRVLELGCGVGANIPFCGDFNLVVDRVSLTHNDTSAIRNSLSLLNKKMKTGAKFIGFDWFSTNHSDYKKGNVGEDQHTED